MKKLIFLSLLTLLDAKTITATYDIYFTLVGRVASTEAKLEQFGDNYKIEINATTEGLANWVTNNARERHISYGNVVDGKFIPDSYYVNQYNNSEERIKEYTFEHKTTTFTQKEYSIKDKKMGNKNTKQLNYFPYNDLTTLYFNMKEIIEKKSGNEIQVVCAGSEDEHGIVVIKDAPNSREINDLLENKKGQKLQIIANQKLYNSNKGQLYVNIDNNYKIDAGVLKDVLWFGDLVLKQTSYKETN